MDSRTGHNPQPVKLLPRIRAELQAATGGTLLTHYGGEPCEVGVQLRREEIPVHLASFRFYADAIRFVNAAKDTDDLLALVETLGAGLRKMDEHGFGGNKFYHAAKKTVLKALEEAGG